MDTTTQEDQGDDLPRFEWVQRTNWINVSFHTGPFSNPLVEVQPPNAEGVVVVTLAYNDKVYTNEIVFKESVTWPCTIHLTHEIGKVELEFGKSEPKIWEDFGVLRQGCQPSEGPDCCSTSNYVIKEHKRITGSIYVMRLERTDGGLLVVPVGRHVRAFGNVAGKFWGVFEGRRGLRD